MVVGVGGMTLLSACHRDAEVLVVTTTADTVDVIPGDGHCIDASAQCSLRAAVMEANATDGIEEIRLTDGATYQLTLAGSDEDAGETGDLDVTSAVDVTGDATIDGGGLDRVFDLQDGVGLVDIDGPDLVGGAAPDGAAVRVRSGSLLLVDSHVTGHVATAGAPVAAGPGSNANLMLTRTTFSANSGTTAGAIDQRSGSLVAVESTFSGNQAGDAGALRVGGATDAQLRRLTITANSGAAAVVASDDADVQIAGSVIAGQTVGEDCSGVIGTLGYNFESGLTCGFTAVTDQQQADPRLGPLGPAGSGQPVHVPLVGSPLLDTTPPDICSSDYDNRGLPRPAGSNCDSGSVEVQVLLVTHGGDAADATVDGSCQDLGGAPGDCALRSAVIEANGRPGLDIVAFGPDVDEVVLDRVGAGEDAAGSGDLDLLDEVIIRGAGTAVDARGLDADGDGPSTGDRVFHVQPSVEARLEGLTVRGGSVNGDGGGLLAEGHLELDQTTVRVNEASGAGGGVRITSTGDGTIRTSVVSANTAGSGGGLAVDGTVDLGWSTIVYNRATSGAGGIDGSAAAVATVGTVLGDQMEGTDCAAAVVVSGGFNLDSDASCGLGASGDLSATDPDLDEDYAPEDISPLVGAGGTDCPALDRYDRGRPQAGACEIGALEKPSTFVVDSTADEPDADVSDGACAGSSGSCTLRAAVQQANAIAGPKTVLLIDPGPYELTSVGADEDGAATGDLDVTEDLEVIGPATIDGSGLDPDGPGGPLPGDRVFHVLAGAEAELWDLTITGGRPDGDGGGVLADGKIVLARSTLAGNAAQRGGGVQVTPSGADSLLAESVVQANAATTGGGVATDAPVRIHGSTITGNDATDGGGVQLGAAGAATVWVSIVKHQGSGSDCSGAAFTSFGHNQTSDPSCGLSEPTDTVGGPGVDERELRPLRALSLQTTGETAIEDPASVDALDSANGRIIRAFAAYYTDVPQLHAVADHDLAVLHDAGYPTALTDSGTLAGAQITHTLLARLATDPLAQSRMGTVDDGAGGMVPVSDLVLAMVREYVDNARPTCDFARDWGSLDLALADPWTSRGTENLAMYRRTTCMLGLYALRDVPGYDNPSDPNRRHWQPWATMLGRWLSERAGNGLLEEVRSPTYSDNTLAGIYNLVDFPGDADLARVARGFLDLYWHDLAHEVDSNTGVAAAAGTRAYQWNPDGPVPDAAGNLTGVAGRELVFPDEDDIWAFLWLYGWHDGPMSKSRNVSLPMLQGATTDYRPLAVSEQLANATGVDFRYRSVRATTGSGGVGERHQILREVVSNDDYTMGITTYGPATLHNGSAAEAMYAKVTANTTSTDQIIITGIASTKPPSTNFADWWSMNGAGTGDALIFARDHKALLPPASCPPPAIPYRNPADLWAQSDCDGNTRGMRVTLGPGAFRDNLIVPADPAGWYFTRAGNTYAAIRFGNPDVEMFDASHQLVASGVPGSSVAELSLDDGADGDGAADIWSPVVIQLGQAADFASFGEFVAQVTAPIDDGGTSVDRYRRDPVTGTVSYTSLAVGGGGSTLEMDRQELAGTLPRVDGVDVEVDPPLAYDSPFLHMVWGTYLATLTGPDGTQVVVDVSYAG